MVYRCIFYEEPFIWKSIVEFFEGRSTPTHVVIHVFIVIGFLIPVGVAVAVFQIVARRFTDRWKKYLQLLTCAGDGKLDLQVSIAASGQETARLVGQFQEIRRRMNHHFDLLATFYKIYFST